MPRVNEITYSRDATVQASRDYFQFLVSMYMDESEIYEPPQNGWHEIHWSGWHNFDKTDRVIDLLRHLPYVDMAVEIAPNCELVDWYTTPADMDGEDIKEATEPHPEDAMIPSHIVGLTLQCTKGLTFLLDTELGVIYWHEWMSEAKIGIPEIEGDPYDWVDDDLISEDKVEWRAGSGIWEITDFFRLLKAKFETLDFVPFRRDYVRAAWYGRPVEAQETLEGAQKIYKDHGWPDLGKYRKNDCLASIKVFLEVRD